MIRIAVLTTVLILAAGPAGADVTLSYDWRDGGDASTVHVSDGRVRMERAGDGTVTLYRSEDDELVIIQPADRTYTVLDEETRRRLKQQVREAMERLKEQLENMPEEQRKRVSGSMGDDGANMTTRLERTGETRKVDGRDCRMYRVLINDEPESKMCVGRAESLGVPEADARTLQRLYATLSEVAAQVMPEGSMKMTMQDIEGIPVMIWERGKKNPQILQSVSTDEVADDRFSIPENYRRRGVARRPGKDPEQGRDGPR